MNFFFYIRGFSQEFLDRIHSISYAGNDIYIRLGSSVAKLNPAFSSFKSEYIFAQIDKKLETLKRDSSASDWINLSVGDIALPLAPVITEAIIRATEEMGAEAGLKGYPPTQGYYFLRQAIVENELKNLSLTPEEIHISDGINSDAVHILDLLHPKSRIALPNPTYPAYFNACIIEGRKKHALFLPCLPQHRFLPIPPVESCDVIYLCTPSNPTGTALTRTDLAAWVTYAQKSGALLCIDSAYAAFVTSPDVPKSIYEIPGAETCAVEWRSFSKTAGFTGLRCAYSVIPKGITGWLGRKKIPLHLLWERRQAIKFNGVSYPIQRGAEASLSPEGQKQTRRQIEHYLSMAKKLREGLKRLGYQCCGGVDSPYIWWKTPEGMSSWQFFDHLLKECHLIAMPGVGFGSEGEGYIRLSAFATTRSIEATLERLEKRL